MEKRQVNADPVLPEVVGAYAESGSARFHMPGHKGRGMGGFMQGGLALEDITELPFSDNLQHPSAAILHTEHGISALYGTSDAMLSVNGSTGALEAMILSLDGGDTLLIGRDCHKSVVAAAALRGLHTECILPEYWEEWGMPGLVSPEALDRRLSQTGATAVLITSPNYCGLCADIPALARCAHARGALLLVDAAHGAHFPFSEALPPIPREADLFCVSLHKTLNALTQSAVLFRNECRIPSARLRRAMRLIQTTSPSYLIMLSMDWAAYTAQRQPWTRHAAFCKALEGKLSQIQGLKTLPPELGGGAVNRDPTRIVVDVSGRGVTGYEALERLSLKGIYGEMADLRRIVLITSPEDEPAWYDRLLDAMKALPLRRRRISAQPRLSCLPEQCMSIREAVFSQSKEVSIKEAEGKILAQGVGVYPPGVAWRLPGERLDRTCIADLTSVKAQGGELFGVENDTVLIVAEETDGSGTADTMRNQG